jgi:5-methylcytosine-specific restriction endonuclease McrA
MESGALIRTKLTYIQNWYRKRYSYNGNIKKNDTKELCYAFTGIRCKTGNASVIRLYNYLQKNPSEHKDIKKQKDNEFYSSWKWKKLRYRVLLKYGAKCMLCGATKEEGAKICVDHIKPRGKYPELELEFENLQVLCNDCNMGKSNDDETDFR